MPPWACACFKPKVTDAGPDGFAPVKPNKESAHCTQLAASAKEEPPVAHQSFGAFRPKDSPSELAQTVQQWRQNDSLDGQNLQQVQALWDRDQLAILRSLSGSIEVS